MSDRARVTVLVPVRNAEDLLPDWFRSVRSFADDVIALDDGSTDRTRDLLMADPLVSHVLTNPVRPTYEGWDDFDNRQRLVHAALAGRSDWCLFLDADERLAPDDAEALRHFLATEAQPGFAYGFEVFRMVDGEDHFDPRGLWVYRLFAAVDADGPLRGGRLHFVPVPEAIPPERWLPVSIRIQHLGSLDEQRRRARFEKYREADPANEFQQDYTSLLDAPASTTHWPTRRPDVPLLLGPAGRYADHLADSPEEDVAITAVVIAQDDAEVIDRSIGALVTQQVDEAFEVILVGSGSDETVSRTESLFPSVRCIQLPEPALPGEARNAGLWAARGHYVTFPGSHVWLTPGSLSARLDAHDEGWHMVTGAVVNGNRSRAGWASYFLDHASQLPTRPSGAYVGAPGHASYLTEDVRGCGGFPEDMRAGEDTVVNQKLFHDGRRTYYRSDASFHHASPARSLGLLCSHHFKRGRALGRIIRGGRTRWQSLLQLPVTASLPGRRLRALRAGMAFADADLRRRYRSVLPLVMSGALASTAGTAYELATSTTPDADHEKRRPTARSSRDGPILAIGGRPGEAACGLLSAGSATQAAQRLTTFTGYANHRTRVVPALAPIVTSATLTYEQHGTHVLHTWSESVRSHLNAARSASGALILQVQPGAATLCDLVAIWAEFLDQPDVGLLIDLRPQVTFCHQGDQLEEVIDRLGIGVDPEAHPVKQTLLTRGLVSGQLPEHAAAADFVDLRQPGTKYPHDLFDTGQVPDAVIYQ